MLKDIEIKRYYSIRDKIANEYCELWSAKNNASALRSFHYSLATQKKQGIIMDEADYELYHVADIVIDENGEFSVEKVCELVVDCEKNNEELE